MKDLSSIFIEHSRPWVKSAFVLLLVACACWQLMAWLEKPTTMPIKHVRIEGALNYITHDEISQSLSQLVQTGYFAMDADAIIKNVTAIEWVEKARVRRVWPDMMVLSLQEQQPVAVWNETALLNPQGEVFQPVFDAALLKLPHLSGITSDSKKLLAEQEKIDRSIESIGVSIKRLALAEHGSWSAVMSNGVKIKAGNQRPDQKISKSLMLLASLDGDLIEHIELIDLRYPNGMAVTWRSGYEFNELGVKTAVIAMNKDWPNKG